MKSQLKPSRKLDLAKNTLIVFLVVYSVSTIIGPLATIVGTISLASFAVSYKLGYLKIALAQLQEETIEALHFRSTITHGLKAARDDIEHGLIHTFDD